MSTRLIFSAPSDDPLEPRIGGGALIGAIAKWPVAPDGNPLWLVASIPSEFLAKYSDVQLPANTFVSVFSYYSEDDYFLDEVTYHGNVDELACIKSGTTKVILHPAGKEVFQEKFIPPYRMQPDADPVVDNDCGSYIGGEPGFLQNEELDLDDLRFVLQLRSSDFPEKYSDIFGLADAVGYLYLDEKGSSGGMFFAQVT